MRLHSRCRQEALPDSQQVPDRCHFATGPVNASSRHGVRISWKWLSQHREPCVGPDVRSPRRATSRLAMIYQFRLSRSPRTGSSRGAVPAPRARVGVSRIRLRPSRTKVMTLSREAASRARAWRQPRRSAWPMGQSHAAKAAPMAGGTAEDENYYPIHGLGEQCALGI